MPVFPVMEESLQHEDYGSGRPGEKVRSCLQIITAKRGEGVAQVVKGLPSQHEALC
jgi:hypothetical protein